MSAIKLTNIKKIYGEAVKVLEDINLDIERGEPVSYTHLTLPTNREV